MTDCPHPTCTWTNAFRTCTDGSREAALYAHEREAHGPCDRCSFVPTGGPCLCRAPTDDDVPLWEGR